MFLSYEYEDLWNKKYSYNILTFAVVRFAYTAVDKKIKMSKDQNCPFKKKKYQKGFEKYEHVDDDDTS